MSGNIPPPQDRVRGLYGIIEAAPTESAAVQALAQSLLEGGMNVLELRMPGSSARVIAETTQALIGLCHGRATLLLSDRLDIALALGTDGIQLGPDDVPTTIAKTLSRPGFLIGRTANTPEGVRNARRAGVDYVLYELVPRGAVVDAGSYAEYLGVCTWIDAPLFPLCDPTVEAVRKVSRPGTAGAAMYFRASDGPVAPERIRSLNQAYQEEKSRGRQAPGKSTFA